MKKIPVYLFLTALVVLISSYLPAPQKVNYTEQWKKVDEFVKQGLPRSAIQIVDQIYQSAQSENNQPQTLKALIYKTSLQSQFKEDHLVNSISTMEQELSVSSPPATQILHSLLAELYYWYYQDNRWQINNRGVVAGMDQNDIHTWDAVKINKIIMEHYLASVKGREQLEKISLENYHPILTQADSTGLSYWPTLYDLLAHRTMDYFSSSDAGFNRFSRLYSFTDTALFSPVNEFIKMKPEGIDSSSENRVLGLYRHLLNYHLKQKNTAALVDLDLKRLQYVYTNFLPSRKADTAYVQALTSLREQVRNQPVFVEISRQLAERYRMSGNKYNPLSGDKYRWDLNTAEKICREALKAFPNARYATECKNLINEINRTEFNVQMEDAVLPGKPFLSFLRFKNTNAIYFRIVELNIGDLLINPSNANRKNKVQQLLSQKPLKHWTQNLPDTEDHQAHTVEMVIPEMNNGLYILIASADPDFNDDQNLMYHRFYVTKMNYMTNNDPVDGFPEVYVVDRESGQPIGGVSIKAYQKVYNRKKRGNEYQYIGEYFTDGDGYKKINLPDKAIHKPVAFLFERGCDQLLTANDNYFFLPEQNTKWQTHTYFFTDRAIYRPGQTVYFKGIVIEKNGNDVRIKPGISANVEFLNTNRKKISSLDLTTNVFGSFQGAFVIPAGGLNGQMRIRDKSGSVSFSVEEYKRPSFRVSFDTIKGEYGFGDSITITGKAGSYTGSAIMDAGVTYRVVRSVIPVPYYYGGYHPFPEARETEITHGKTTTRDDGSFVIRFVATPAIGVPGLKNPPSRFTIYVDVTDITGEVQSGTTNLPIGTQNLILTVLAEDKVNKEKNEGVRLKAENLSGAPVDVKVFYDLYKLSPPDRLINSRYWPRPDINLLSEEKFKELFPHAVYGKENNKQNWPKQLVYNGKTEFRGTTGILKKILAEAKPGNYLLSAKTITGKGDTVEAKKYFTFYSSKSKQRATNDIIWSAITKKKAEPGDVVQLVIGTAAKKTRVFYQVINGNEIVKSAWLKLSGNQKVIDLPVLENYRGNFAIRVYATRFNRFYQDSYLVKVPFSNKKLNVSLETRRDYLTPGMQEEWRVKISGPQGEHLVTELLAGMYDASLDVFRKNNWDLSLYHPKQNKGMWKTGYFKAGWASRLYSRPMDHTITKPVLYPRINWFGYQHFSRSPVLMRGEAMQKEIPLDEMEETTPSNKSEQGNNEKSPALSSDSSNQKKSVNGMIPLRTNFNETAFFYPRLMTDSLGNVVLRFTTSDALTEWKLMLLATTKDLKTGSLVKKIKARKELMVVPNLPRFVRQGDQLVFSARVVNFTDKTIQPRVSIEFFDPVSGKKAAVLGEGESGEKSLTLTGRKNGLVQWHISIPDQMDMLAYRIKARSHDFSDGEERMIPVLSNRMLVTETLPLNINGNQTKEFTFKKLVDSDKTMVSSMKNFRFTVEFTSNPAWYAVQALPYLSESKIDNTDYVFKNYYANALSAYIVNSNPKIKTVFESWKQLSPESFYSNLQKNKELKNLVLQATPWVLEAADETEQKRRIGILFDVNRLANEKETAMSKLMTKQLPGGAWPWFSGMREDRHTTQNIVVGFAKLNSKGVIDLSANPQVKQMIGKALNYLDKKIAEDYAKLQKNNPQGMKNYSPGSVQIEYLYARALLMKSFPVKQNVSEAFDFYLGQAKKFWLKKSNYLQGMTALTLYRLGYRNEAEAIMRSLNERALHNDETGMYWRTRQSWNWYQAPVETQALLIEAFNVIMNDSRSVEAMKIWLLKQKQTTHWNTNSATAEAVYSLLFNGRELLTENKPVILKVGNKKIIPGEKEGMKTEAGTGYFKISWQGSEVKPAMGNISLTNPNNGIAWGGAYWQYFENLDRISPADSPLSIKKQLFINELTDNGPVMKPLEEGQLLHSGDKLISRLVISTDRNMDYVQVTDMRAAALEPVHQLSGYAYQGGLGFYQSLTDVSMEFFIQHMNKGTYVLEYPLLVTQQGEFSNGIATIQSFYAPEFAAHSRGWRLMVR